MTLDGVGGVTLDRVGREDNREGAEVTLDGVGRKDDGEGG